MAAFDTQSQRWAMMGWGIGGITPEASGSFDGLDAQMILGLAGQYDIDPDASNAYPSETLRMSGRYQSSYRASGKYHE